MKKLKINSNILTLVVSIFLIVFYNNTFWNKVLVVFPNNSENLLFLLSLFIFIIIFVNLLLSFINIKYILKPFLIILFIASSSVSYFTDSYGVVINDNMINNMLQTQTNEVLDLLNEYLFIHNILFMILPIIIILTLNVTYNSFKKELFYKIKLILSSLIIIAILLFSFSKFYTTFFREHKELRWYINPTYYIYSSYKVFNQKLNIWFPKEFIPYGNDAKIISTSSKPKLLVFVVGEAARADHFSLNNYKKETNPYLKQQDIINFSNVSSCGTETMISVPCMFSILNKSNYNEIDFVASNNSIDILNIAGTRVLWRDNNSNHKDVMKRLGFVDMKYLKNKDFCKNNECRDEILLNEGLQTYIDKDIKDTVIILHSMGSHGPAYYKRYPKEFEKFTPICKSSKFEDCTKEEISNAYDNTILYSDYFLNKTIEFLKTNSNKYNTAMIYMSDHGESLGENGIYLHGMPYSIAPKAQTHVGNIMWFDKDFNINQNCLKSKKDNKLSQDNVYHSLLGLMEVQTKDYDKKLDIFNTCR